MIPTTYATQKTGLEAKFQPRPDEYAKAVRLFYDTDAKKFELYEEVASVVGNYEEGKTKDLADLFFCSITTVQNYAKVGKLWIAIGRAYPTDAEVLRDELQTGFWLPVARLWANDTITLAGAFQWLKIARSKKAVKGFNVDKFRNSLPDADGSGSSEYAATMKQLQFRAQSLMATLDEAMTAPAFDVDEKQYKKLQRALRLVKGRAANVMRQPIGEAK